MFTNAYLNRFRGSRNYVQGTDIVNALLEYSAITGDEKNVLSSVKFRSFARETVYFAMEVCNSTEFEQIGTFGLNGASLRRGYIYSGRPKVSRRRDYDDTVFS